MKKKMLKDNFGEFIKGTDDAGNEYTDSLVKAQLDKKYNEQEYKDWENNES